MTNITEQNILKSIANIIDYIGDSSIRLSNTPKKMMDIFKNHTFIGYTMNAKEIFSKLINYENKSKQMIVLNDIPFLSFCEHHFMPITGKITIGYIPNNYIIGIGKLHQLIDLHTKRLQLQEYIADNIANDIKKYLQPLFTGVYINSSQYCIGCYSTCAINTEMINSCFIGSEKEENKIEFFNMIKR